MPNLTSCVYIMSFDGNVDVQKLKRENTFKETAENKLLYEVFVMLIDEP